MSCPALRGVLSWALLLAAPAMAQHPASSADKPHTFVGWLHQKHTQHVCPDCQLKLALRQAEGSTVVIEGPAPGTMIPGSSPAASDCPMCDGQAHPSVIQPMMPAHAHQGIPAGRCAACEASGFATLVAPEAPGYANLGVGRAMSLEPMPIGVVQANYSGQPAAAAVAPTGRRDIMMEMHAGNAASARPPVAGPSDYPGYHNASHGPINPPRDKRPRILAHLLGVDGWSLTRIGQERAEREAAAHAAMPMGNLPVAGPSQLPASMVYPNR